ncbi:phosphotransferase family protein [Euzebya tangerina]|uniref:phosphotransferase family protein n=1 Tax=Euzebya tangerina TaxID=591198 RepID=UPI000E318671|nr:phosphotransferase [Euzebya tangerina]
MERGRRVRLVVVDRDRVVRGVIEDLRVAEPWWPETGPILDVVPEIVVLRLLDATPDPDEPMGGRVTYLVQHDGVVPLDGEGPAQVAGHAVTSLPTAWGAVLDDHPLRQPWARVNGPAADLRWASSHVGRTGRARQHRTWNLSSIWSLPTTGGVAWLKCVPSFMQHESVVLAALAGQAVPRLIAAADHRQLLAPMQGVDGYAATEDDQRRMLAALVRLQLDTVDLLPGLLAAGVPDRRTPTLQEELLAFLDRLGREGPELARLREELPGRLAAAEASGLPDVLVHGDVHPGNCRLGTDPPLWFDWGDSVVGHPLLDLATADRLPAGVRAFWLSLWADAVPHSRPDLAWTALEPVALLRQASVYQGFLDRIEPSERIYHADDVGRWLRKAEAAMRRHWS